MGTVIKKYMWVVNLLAVVVISFLLAKMATLFIASYFPDVVISPKIKGSSSANLGEREQKEVDIETILKRNFFDAEETVFNTPTGGNQQPVEDNNPQVTEETKTPENQVAVKTSLDVQLISTVSVGDGRNKMSSCVISAGRANDVYTVKDEKSFSPGTQIVRILPKRVEFLNNGTLEYVELLDFAKGMDPNARPDRSALLNNRRRVTRQEEAPEEESSGEVQREGNSFTIPRTEVDKALANLPRMYTEIRAVPYFKNGKANGFKLINVKAGSLFEKLGLRRGDILKSINGTVLDIQTGLQTFNNLKNESNFSLEVERRGLEQSFTYQII